VKTAATALILSATLALPALAQSTSTPTGQQNNNMPAASTNTPAGSSAGTTNNTATPGAANTGSSRPMNTQASTASGSMFVTASGNLWPADRLEDVEVFNDKNEKIGTIEDVLVDDQGKIGGVVVSVGGFLGMGERHVAVSFNALRWEMGNNANRGTTTGSNTQNAAKAAPERAVLAGATKDQLQNAPQYRYEN
jgi:sporulation protein YlmC with PRC-barrel domain